ncbi:uncharacterized protein ACNLHF_004514 isoform 1-T3 [Anomaloglossus baeobatrachus]|uniref:uncharacterized protein LOC142260629 n=1 Tax=Anomaloglossus baeobatrachus TaxID=238106 RepID=UPI003F4FE0BA
MSEFARFMVSRELINTSLTKFDDRAESYRAWKATFKAAIANLNFTAEQELNLLIKWLGPGSTNRIKSLRTVFVGQAEAGLAAAWQRLERTFGSADAIEKALFKRLQDIPKINLKEVHKLQDLSDLLMELELAKRDPRLSGLCYLDTAHGVNPIVVKLPYSLQEKWATSVSRYKRMHDVTFPPFIQFCKFMDEQAQMRNDPSLDFLEFNTSAAATSSSRYEGAIHTRRDIKNTVSVRKTELPSPAARTDKQNTISSRDKSFNQECPIHKKPHSLNKCRGFRSKTLQERKKVLTELGICFKCCASLEHMAKDCKSIVKCEECHSEKHVSAMHPTQLARDTPAAVTTTPTPSHGGEPKNQTDTTTAVPCSCSEVCGEGQTQKCCARICLIKVYPEGHPEKAMKVYAIIDDQSNRSLAGTKFFEAFGINGPSEPYTLNTCSGRIETSGRRAQGFIASPINGKTEIPLPTLVECDQIPSHRNGIPTPEAAFHQPHLRHLASVIPPLDNNAEILLLLGRDNLRVHKVRQQCNGPDYAPYAQRLDLGWVVIGNVCVDRSEIDSFKTYVHGDGRTTCLKPCPHHYGVKEKSPDTIQLPDIASSLHIDNLGRSVFHTTKDDDKVALSVEDREFIGIMDCEFSKDKTNHWVSPLPFRSTRVRLPNNRAQAQTRFNSLQRSMNSKPEMREHSVAFMDMKVSNNLAEHVPAELNPADHATRPTSISSVANSSWLTGPEFLLRQSEEGVQEAFSILVPDNDPDVRAEVNTLATSAEKTSNLGCQRFERFSSWMRLVRTVARLVHIARCCRTDLKNKDCHRWHVCHKALSAEDISHSESLIIRHLQQSEFAIEWKCLYNKQQISLRSPLANLNPVIDSFGLLRVGGRLNQAHLGVAEQNPLIIPSKHHVTVLLIRHHHEKTEHQGRQITEGALRSAGLWIIGMKRRVAQILHDCVHCRKARGKQLYQQMADLPTDRLSTEPPFTYVGLDVFGPWMVSTRRTRGGQANSKRWAVLFTCMSVRAVHIEVLESMDTSSLINVLRRFLAIRGPVKQLRSDRGSNFVGACRELNIDTKPIQDQLAEKGCTWIFNPPHSSHMGGSWERMIGISRNILNSMLMDVNSSRLTHETLVTLLAEVSAIINSRPLVPVTMDPETPTILTPTILITQKTDNAVMPSGEFTHANTYQKHWKRVQYLADYFWNRWRKEYLTILQGRKKWRHPKPNLKEGDLVLMKDQTTERTDWPMGLITRILPSQDGNVRKVELKVIRKGETKTFARPIHELVLLLPIESVPTG